MIKLSTLTLEVKLRYLSVVLLIMSFCFIFPIFTAFFDVIGIDITVIESFGNAYFKPVEPNTIIMFTMYLIPSALIWAMFNRWYFMIPTMIILGVVLLFTIVLGLVTDDSITSHPEKYVGYFMSVIAEILIVISFTMYLKRTIKNRKVTST